MTNKGTFKNFMMMLRKQMTLMDNESFFKSDVCQFLVHKTKLSAVRLLNIISNDKIINPKSLGDIWHRAGNEFKELSDVAKHNYLYSSVYS